MAVYTTSYAQNREDIIIDAFFDGKTEGFYVDVGANHPVQDSVTKLFYEKGWRGINIEPNQELADLLRVDRPRDVVVQKGVSSAKGVAILRQYINADGLSTYSDSIKELKDDYYTQFKKDYVDVETQVDTLSGIIADFAGGNHIDFLKVDVEGFEYEALLGFVPMNNMPELICIESNHVEKDWRPLLKKLGYVCFFNDGLNDYYALKHSSRMAEFSFPEKVFMRYPKIVPFIPSFERVDVDDSIFTDEPSEEGVVNSVSSKQQLVWSLLGLDSAIRTGFTRLILKTKYDSVDRVVVSNLLETQELGVVRGANTSGGLRAGVFKICLLGYGFIVKALRIATRLVVR